MNNTSDYAFELTQDIYTLAGSVDRLTEQYDNRQISEQVYFKKLYVYACEASYLDGVVTALKAKKYKFTKYVKELSILEAIIEEISLNLDMENMNSVTFPDMKNLKALMEKYKSIVPNDLDENLSEEL